MSSDSSLGGAIADAINVWLGENGGGFTNAFVLALDYVNSDGKPVLLVSDAGEQPTHRSLGLSEYLALWYRDDAQAAWAQTIWSGGDEDD